MSNETTAEPVSSPQSALEAAGERLGLLMQQASEEEKAILRGFKSKVEEFAQEHSKDGRYLDRSAMFAAVIAVDERFSSTELISAARDYLEKDMQFLKSTT